jgi:Putative amidase domain
MAYNRAAAVAYAQFFADRICHDGKFATRGSYPVEINKVRLEPGLPLSRTGEPADGVDCTHFISCCMGDHSRTVRSRLTQLSIPIPMFSGGGLNISCPLQGVYGLDNTPTLVQELKTKHGAKVIGNEFQQKPPDTPTKVSFLQPTDDAIKDLEPGDLLAYASRNNPSAYEHICLIVEKGGKISCHSNSRFGLPYTAIKSYDWVTLLKMP